MQETPQQYTQRMLDTAGEKIHYVLQQATPGGWPR